MKKYFILLLFVLSGCSEQFKTGDCYIIINTGDNAVYKITKFGEYSYEAKSNYGLIVLGRVHENMKHVDCFDVFEDKK